MLGVIGKDLAFRNSAFNTATEIHEQQKLKELMKPCPDDWLSKAEASSLVNSAKNNMPEVLQPVSRLTAREG